MVTASEFPASRLKNHTPGFPPHVTYVRTFSSGNRESHGRCATSSKGWLMGVHKAFSTSSFPEYTLPIGPRIEFSGFKKNERAKRRESMQRKASAVWQGGLKD